MTISPRMRIAKSGKSVFSTDPRDFILDERYNMFKYHSTSTANVTLNAGSTENSTTVAHSLGYVPAYLVYYQRSDESVERLVPSLPFGVDFDIYPWAYATSTGIVVGVSSATPYNQLSYPLGTVYNNDGGNFAWVGTKTGAVKDFGIQYQSVALVKDQAITSATIDFKADDTGSGSQDIKMNIWGIDVDNLGDFGSDLGQAKTTATHSQNQSALNDGDHFDINVKSELEEIIGRAGWVTGNNLGFYIFDNGTSTVGNNYVASFFENQVILNVVTGGSVTVSFRVVIFKDKISP